jgi:hypothetical protein
MMLNRKLLIVSVFVVFLLVMISFASAVNSNTEKNVKTRGGSPLFRIRVRKALSERVGDILNNFFGERVFFLPFQWLRNFGYSANSSPTASGTPSCPPDCKK